MSRLGERSENNNININNINKYGNMSIYGFLVSHKRIRTLLDPRLKYYLITYVCNYTNDTQKSYDTLYNAIQKMCEHVSQMAVGWEVNDSGYMHVHMLVSFARVPKFTTLKVTGCTLNYKQIQNEQWRLNECTKYIYKDFDEYGFSRDAVCLEHKLKHYCIVPE